MRVVRYAETFWNDVAAQIEYALERDEREWTVKLTDDIVELQRLLAEFPDAGVELDRDGAMTLRKLRLRRCPFLVWYTADRERVVIARLFHARQATPEPRLP